MHNELRPLRVRCFVVLAAVAFDHQASTMACEVHDKAAERNLPAKSSLGKDSRSSLHIAFSASVGSDRSNLARAVEPIAGRYFIG